MLSSWKHIRTREKLCEQITHLLLFVTAEDPTPVESLLPVFAGVIVRSVCLATVDTSSVMRTVLTLRGGGDRRVVLGLAVATRCKSTVEGKGVGFSAQRAELSLERTRVSHGYGETHRFSGMG